jgi:serine/threonine protein kinase
LGEGGFGAVMPVIQLDYGPAKDKPRKGALKVLKNRNVTRSEFEAFQSEMVRLSGLRHQNIAMLYDWPKENKELWFVMELVGESNLHDLCAREKLVPKVVLKYTLDLFYALRYLHEVEKLVHFDIKPLNIGVRDDRSAIALLDFGLSFEPRREEPKHPPTIEYCPPELFKPIDQNYEYAAADVYSAAISIIQMVTGKIPWDATRAVSNELIAEICNRGPSWAGINNNGLIHFLKPLLHFDPKRRPTAAEVVEHLEKNNFAPWTDAKYRKVAESYDDMRKRAFAK